MGRKIPPRFSLFIYIDIVKFDKKLCINKHRIKKEFCRGGFICLMNASAEKTEGAFIIGIFRTECTGVRQMFCIGSAAHGIRFPMVFMENAVDNSHAGSYFIGIRRGIGGFCIGNIVYGNAVRFNGFGDFFEEFITVFGYGITDID